MTLRIIGLILISGAVLLSRDIPISEADFREVLTFGTFFSGVIVYFSA